MQPLGKRVLIRHTDPGAFHADSFLIKPEAYRGTTNEGTVLAIGTEVPEGDLKIGQRVMFEKRAGQVVLVGGKKLRLMHWDKIVAQMEVGVVKLCPACGGQGTVVQHAKRNKEDQATSSKDG